MGIKFNDPSLDGAVPGIKNTTLNGALKLWDARADTMATFIDAADPSKVFYAIGRPATADDLTLPGRFFFTSGETALTQSIHLFTTQDVVIYYGRQLADPQDLSA